MEIVVDMKDILAAGIAVAVFIVELMCDIKNSKIIN